MARFLAFFMLFHLSLTFFNWRFPLSCLLVRGMRSRVPQDSASNSGCLASVCGSLCSSQVAPLGGAPEGDICGGLSHLWAQCSLFWRKAIKSAFLN